MINLIIAKKETHQKPLNRLIFNKQGYWFDYEVYFNGFKKNSLKKIKVMYKKIKSIQPDINTKNKDKMLFDYLSKYDNDTIYALNFDLLLKYVKGKISDKSFLNIFFKNISSPYIYIKGFVTNELKKDFTISIDRYNDVIYDNILYLVDKIYPYFEKHNIFDNRLQKKNEKQKSLNNIIETFTRINDKVIKK